MVVFRIRSLLGSCCFLLQIVLMASVEAATIVRVQTNLGEFELELFEDRAPATVGHFLANLEAGNYQFSMVHEVNNDSIFGGSYFFNVCSEGPVPVSPVSQIPIEQTGLENTNGSIALLRDPENPEQVGSSWTINLNNNTNLYTAGEEPVVFGEVTSGLVVANQIADAWVVPMNISPSVPTVNFDGNLNAVCGFFTADNVIKVAMTVESIDPPATEAANSFDVESSMLNLKVDGGAEGLLSLSMLLQSMEPEVILQVQPETVTVLPEAVENMAVFDANTNALTIPELEVGGSVLYTNLVLVLTDAENLLFTLQSFSTP